MTKPKSFIILVLTILSVLPAQVMCSGNMEQHSVMSQKPKITYISIGDSIARGYGLEKPEQQRFSTVLSKKFEEDVTELNYGKDGQKSAELAAAVKSDSIEGLKDADLITVSIGANDILSPALEFLYDYYMYLFSDSSGIGEKDIENSFARLTESAYSAVGQFGENVESLINGIRSINPDARIVFLNVYNPYAKSEVTIHAGTIHAKLSKLSDGFILPINEIIMKKSKELGFETADIHTAFEASDKKCVNAADDFSDISKLDPHPTKEGHEVIAEEIFRIIQVKK